MWTRRIILALAVAVFAGTALSVVWGQVTTQEARKIAGALRPYQTLCSRVSSNNLDIIFVLDLDAKRLAVLKYDSANRALTAIGGRELAKDFGSEEGGGYSMTNSQQTTDSPCLLYVTDYGAGRIIVYEVDPYNNKVTPQQPVDLKKVFGS